MSAAVSAIAVTLVEGEEPGGARAVDLRQVWAEVTDPRDRRGRRHSLVVILALVQAAVVGGATTFAAIRHWIGAAPQHVLADIGARQDPRTGRFQAPHPDTVCRVVEQVDAAEVDAAYARYRAAQMAGLYDDADDLIAMTVDGKTQRGTGDGQVRAQHRMGAMLAADAITVAQLDVDGKSNEITAFIPLLDQIPDLADVVISADMMHTQREHARYLHRRGAYFVLPVGGNQPGLFHRLDALAWQDTPIGWSTYDRGHGRQEIRTIQVRPAPAGIKSPHVKQVFLIERWCPPSAAASA